MNAKKRDILGLLGSKGIEKLGFLFANTSPKIKINPGKMRN